MTVAQIKTVFKRLHQQTEAEEISKKLNKIQWFQILNPKNRRKRGKGWNITD